MKKCYLIFLCFFIQSVYAASENNIYQYTQANMLAPAVKNALYRVYVPNGKSGTVSVIDPLSYKVIDTFPTGRQPQHIVPSYDLQTLWVLNNKSNSITPINPVTAKPGQTISVTDPYNLYFTPDGNYALVVCESRKRLEFRDPKTMQLKKMIETRCKGANHMDFTPDGHYAIVTCEYGGELMKIDLSNNNVIGYLSLAEKEVPKALETIKVTEPSKKIAQPIITIQADGHGMIKDAAPKKAVMVKKIEPVHMRMNMPQDIRSSSDGKIFFVADMMQDGVFIIDPIQFKKIGFIKTSLGAHGIYPSRDGKLFYVSNRGCHSMRYCPPHGPGSISVVDPIKKSVIATWPIPNGGSPDMGNVTADGKELWLSGRYDNEVYVFDTKTGQLTHRIPVGKGPHGLSVWPQPGRYSLGHTGNMR